MREAAQEAGRAKIAVDHLGPLVPGRRAAVLEEEIEELMSALRPAQAGESADGAQLIGRVVFPVRGAPALFEFIPIALESVLHDRVRQVRQLAAGAQSDGSGGGV